MASSSAGSGGGGEAGVEQSRQTLGAGLRPIHADQRPDRGRPRGSGLHRLDHVVGVDHDGRLVIGEIVVELVGKADVDQRGDGADPPAREQADQIVHAVVGEDRDAVALAHAEMMQRAGEMLHRRDRLGEGQRAVAVDPAERESCRDAVWRRHRELMHQHACNLGRLATRPPTTRNSRGAGAAPSAVDDDAVRMRARHDLVQAAGVEHDEAAGHPVARRP